ncbi:MAG: hypothetical protein E6R06_17220 [Mycobacterium sp.]|nr:MAG: hypothetical protein E6R06_17220 [Mycobacterium sp.]
MGVIGWRFWYVSRDHETPRLIPPYGGNPDAAANRPITTRTVHAVCIRDPRHRPPVADCECGIYAVENVVDACYRYQVIRSNLKHGTKSMWAITPASSSTIPVLARVTLTRVRWIDQRPGSPYRCISPEMRAGRATIECLYFAQAPAHLAKRLGADLGVPVVAGLPRYSCADWEQRPPWYQRGGPEAGLGAYDEYEPLFRDGQPVVPFTGTAPRVGGMIDGSATADINLLCS